MEQSILKIDQSAIEPSVNAETPLYTPRGVQSYQEVLRGRTLNVDEKEKFYDYISKNRAIVVPRA